MIRNKLSSCFGPKLWSCDWKEDHAEQKEMRKPRIEMMKYRMGHSTLCVLPWGFVGSVQWFLASQDGHSQAKPVVENSHRNSWKLKGIQNEPL